MLHAFLIGVLAVSLLLLVRAKVIQIDLSFPWFAGVVVLGFASTQPAFVNWAGAKLGIEYAPIAVVFLVIFLLTGIVVTLTISVTRLRARQEAMVRLLAARDLDAQETRDG